MSRMSVTLHGMTRGGDIVVDCKYSDGSHTVLIYKHKNGEITIADQLQMNSCATMTLMPTDDFVYSDTGEHSGLTSWNLPTNVSNTCLYVKLMFNKNRFDVSSQNLKFTVILY